MSGQGLLTAIGLSLFALLAVAFIVPMVAYGFRRRPLPAPSR